MVNFCHPFRIINHLVKANIHQESVDHLRKIIYLGCQRMASTDIIANTTINEINDQMEPENLVKRDLEVDDHHDKSSKKIKSNDNKTGLIKPRKFAVLLSYCGHGYYGMQR